MTGQEFIKHNSKKIGTESRADVFRGAVSGGAAWRLGRELDVKSMRPHQAFFRGSTLGSDVAIVTAATFALVVAVIGGLSDGTWNRSPGSGWHLRGTIAPTDARWVERRPIG